jgi:hypothetical protein
VTGDGGWFTEGFDTLVLKQAKIAALAAQNVNECN